MFIDMKKQDIYYFDSYADEAPREIEKLGKKIQMQSETFGKNTNILKIKRDINGRIVNVECIVYIL